MKYLLVAVALWALCYEGGAVTNGKHDDGHPHTGQKDGHHKYRRSPSPQAGPLGTALNSPLLQPLQGLLAPLRNALAALAPPAAAPAAVPAAAPVAVQG